MALSIRSKILQGEHRDRLPTLHVQASLHALFRCEYRDKELKGNDLFDFGHTAAALGYCSVFLTEAGIEKAVTHRHD